MSFKLDDDELVLTAFRHEAYRYTRLAELLGKVHGAIGAARLQAAWDGEKHDGALRRLDDRKGDLTATWRSQKDADQFASFVNEAWRELGEDGDDVAHEVLSK